VTTKTTGIRELKANLSDYLKKIQSGDTIIVTEHHRPAAALGAPEEESLSLSGQERMLALREAGLLIWKGGDFALEPIEPAHKLREDVLMSDLVSEGRD
jgi:antitoxin (DNA-binding transcriptional repressor) of toxin-antitoxin stability system